MLNKIIFIITILGIFLSLPSHAQDTFNLAFHTQSLQQLKNSEEIYNTKSKGFIWGQSNLDAPEINLISPTHIETLKSPFDIKIVFDAANNAKIDIASFKAKYWFGFLKKDITGDIKKHSVVNNNSILATKVSMPIGYHVITIFITDNKGRTTEKDLTFKVIK